MLVRKNSVNLFLPEQLDMTARESLEAWDEGNIQSAAEKTGNEHFRSVFIQVHFNARESSVEGLKQFRKEATGQRGHQSDPEHTSVTTSSGRHPIDRLLEMNRSDRSFAKKALAGDRWARPGTVALE